jgi:sugar-specific transcriptional regulator TrmB
MASRKYLNTTSSLGSNNMKDVEILKELGFTDGEIKVYLSLFALGEITVGPISKKSGVTHAKVYPILDKLIDKGLVSHVIKEGRKYFSATNPNRMLEFIDNKVKHLEEEKIKVKEMIPSLLAKQKEQEKIQYSRVFEGFRGLKALFRELFEDSKGEVYVFGLNEPIKKTGFKNFFLYFHEVRKKNHIKLKLIFDKNIKSYFEKEYAPTGNYKAPDKVKFIDVVLPTGVFIFKDHVVSIVDDEQITAFDIKSRQNAERYRKFFEEVWKKSRTQS